MAAAPRADRSETLPTQRRQKPGADGPILRETGRTRREGHEQGLHERNLWPVSVTRQWIVSRCYIHAVDVAALDLNLLVVLEALLEKRSVTRAAQQVGLSQSALSSALGRLRVSFGDPLFVRSAAGMVPTPRALELEPELRSAMASLRRVIHPGAFDPAAGKMTFRIATGDYAELLMLPPLLAALARRAPSVGISVVPIASNPIRRLEDGSSDVVIAPFLEASADVEVDALFDDGFVCAMRKGHPAARNRLTLTRFARLGHLLISPEGEGVAYVDHVLGLAGLSRQVVARVPHFSVAERLLAGSDLIATLPSRLVGQMTKASVVSVRPPFETRTFGMKAAWHRRSLASPAHRWFRSLVVEVARGLGVETSS
jgi:DNA-binding transcriptional LysR family regulator